MTMAKVESSTVEPPIESQPDASAEKASGQKPPPKMTFTERLRHTFARFTIKGNKGKTEPNKLVKQKSHDSIIRKPSEKPAANESGELKKTKSFDDTDTEIAAASVEAAVKETEPPIKDSAANGKHELIFSGTHEECQKLIESDTQESACEEPAPADAVEQASSAEIIAKDQTVEAEIEKVEESKTQERTAEESKPEESKPEELKVEEAKEDELKVAEEET